MSPTEPLKFTEKGEVVLRVDREGEGGDRVELHFTVIDTGIGIPLDKPASIFESFTRPTTRRRAGSGAPRRGLPPRWWPGRAASRTRDVRALVVDDNATNRRILDEMLSRWGDRELLTRLLGIFADDGPGHLRALHEAMAASDPAALMQAAHTLKGSLYVFGAGTAAALAEQLEALGRAGGIEATPALLAAFEPELQRVLRAAAEAAAPARPA